MHDEATINCPSCGQQYPAGTESCRRCGRQLVDSDFISQQHKPKGIGYILCIFLTFGLTSAGCIGLILYFLINPQDETIASRWFVTSTLLIFAGFFFALQLGSIIWKDLFAQIFHWWHQD